MIDYAKVADILRFLATLNNDSLDYLTDAEFRKYVKTQAARFDIENPAPTPSDDKAKFTEALNRFVEGAQKKVDEHHEGFWSTPETLASQRETLIINPNSRRYIGIFARRNCDEASSRGRIFAFIDSTNGDVLKPASWRMPAKHARGNIFDASNGLSHVSHYGPAYL